VIVVDASAAVSALLNAGPARQALATERLHVPHLADVEVASALRRKVSAHALRPPEAWRALDTWRRLGITRYPMFSLLDRVWTLRRNLSTYDATYVALAEELACPLLTADGRLAGVPGIRCPVTVVPG
jgi:predicted nucleic acid-binding protein